MSNVSKSVPSFAFQKSGVPSPPEDHFHLIDMPDFWRDLLLTAAKMAEFLHGTPDEARSVYHVVSSSKTLPTFKYGSRLAARKSVIRATFWARERRAFRDQNEEDLVRLGILLVQLNTIVRTTYAEPSAPRDVELWTLVLAETMRTIDRVVASR
jgi:hypothetical protein